jgi:hypothetical protein
MGVILGSKIKFSFKKILPFYILLVCLISKLPSQVIPDSIYNDNIKTVLIYKEGWEMSPPVIFLNSEDKLRISFDDLNTENKNYYYTLIHCNSNWEAENISFFDYAEGFDSNPITDYLYSTNTVVNYIHYSFSLPGENCKPIISGNYMLKVFAENNPDKIIFTRKIFIVEKTASIDFSVVRPEIPRYMLKYQQYKVKVTPNVDGYNDLRSEIKTLVFQNFNLANPKTCFLSQLQNDKTMLYDDPDSNLFEGGNEFRNFDIKSIKYQSIRIKSITYLNNYYDIVLHPDEWRNKKQYFTDIDLNGRFYIENSLGVNKNRDADYVMVHISLPTIEPLLEGNLYVFGGFLNWQCNVFSKMNYSNENRAYEFNILLKQGYYNYQFAYKSTDSAAPDISYVERNHYETENDYQVFVYYYPQGSRFERLIGFANANSLNK